MSLKAERVASIIKRVVSNMINNELTDPHIGFVTITDVIVTNDLSFAKVFVTFLGKQERNDAGLAALNKAKGRIRTECAKNLSTRKTPDLIFMIDESYMQGQRIEQIISELNLKENSSSK